jgi:hypothetical protein
VQAADGSLHTMCMNDLKASAHVLETAVATVATAAAQTGQQPPSAELVRMCFTAVGSLLGALCVVALAQCMEACRCVVTLVFHHRAMCQNGSQSL